MRLLTAAAAGTGIATEIRESLNRNKHQLYTLYVWGTLDGSTVALQISPDNVNWFSTGVAITAPGAQNVEFRAPFVRATVTGGTAPSVNALLL